MSDDYSATKYLYNIDGCLVYYQNMNQFVMKSYTATRIIIFWRNNVNLDGYQNVFLWKRLPKCYQIQQIYNTGSRQG